MATQTSLGRYGLATKFNEYSEGCERGQGESPKAGPVISIAVTRFGILQILVPLVDIFDSSPPIHRSNLENSKQQASLEAKKLLRIVNSVVAESLRDSA